ncbi:hypothetical protein N7462_007357 [Penicillium macrosclerotiorum]|uniref:uncharacterized protein n=1 Tax=Penicillium macrosclerotiorum TaxID=303699 RepID=UPI00254895C2|nr:uncharacterized protein N7462_007357 [Penicillium macrosclerotiorum]KAJ5679113.1 hypothetical protein N7462_007357 [Penicillium macrosclerotiorum]
MAKTMTDIIALLFSIVLLRLGDGHGEDRDAFGDHVFCGVVPYDFHDYDHVHCDDGRDPWALSLVVVTCGSSNDNALEDNNRGTTLQVSFKRLLQVMGT